MQSRVCKPSYNSRVFMYDSTQITILPAITPSPRTDFPNFPLFDGAHTYYCRPPLISYWVIINLLINTIRKHKWTLRKVEAELLITLVCS